MQAVQGKRHAPVALSLRVVFVEVYGVPSALTTRHPPAAIVWVACYVLYAVVLALCVLSFIVWQRATLVLASIVVGDERGMPAVHGAAVLACVLVLFGVAMAAEPYFRAGVRRRVLVGRFLRVAVGLIVAIALGGVTVAVAYRSP